MPKPIHSIDAANKQVVFGHPGLHTVTVTLDPWPSTQAEIESQARAQIADIPSDPCQLPQKVATTPTSL